MVSVRARAVEGDEALLRALMALGTEHGSDRKKKETPRPTDYSETNINNPTSSQEQRIYIKQVSIHS